MNFELRTRQPSGRIAITDSSRLRTGLLGATVASGLAVLAGCATGAAGLGEQAGTAELPSGLTMLGSVAAECGDSVHIGAGTLADARLGPELFVQPGQNATFRLNETPVNWACIDDDSRDFHMLECEDGASFVRITRATDGGELLLECFG